MKLSLIEEGQSSVFLTLNWPGIYFILFYFIFWEGYGCFYYVQLSKWQDNDSQQLAYIILLLACIKISRILRLLIDEGKFLENGSMNCAC